MFISYLTIITKFKCLESSKDCHFSDKGPSCMCWSCVMIPWHKLIHHFFAKKMKTSLANKNPNKMHHYKNRLKSGYGHMFNITRPLPNWIWSECGNNFEFFRYFDANWLWKGECRVLARQSGTWHLAHFRGRVEMSGDYNCSFHFITHHHCPNYSIQMLCVVKNWWLLEYSVILISVSDRSSVCEGSEWI